MTFTLVVSSSDLATQDSIRRSKCVVICIVAAIVLTTGRSSAHASSSVTTSISSSVTDIGSVKTVV
jgi:hypothetical protein